MLVRRLQKVQEEIKEEHSDVSFMNHGSIIKNIVQPANPFSDIAAAEERKSSINSIEKPIDVSKTF